MKTLQEIKDQYARDLGYPNWWSLDFNKTNLSQEAIRDKVSELYAQSRVSELERENAQQKEWLEAYKKSNAEFMKSTTDQKFEIERLQKENGDLRKVFLSYQRTIQRLQGEVETFKDRE